VGTLYFKYHVSPLFCLLWDKELLLPTMSMIYNYLGVFAFPYHLFTAGLPQSGILQPLVPIMSETDDDYQPYLAQLEFYPHSWNSPLTRECSGSAHYVALRTMPFYIALLLACMYNMRLNFLVNMFQWGKQFGRKAVIVDRTYSTVTPYVWDVFASFL
jgi:hypothetical protein